MATPMTRLGGRGAQEPNQRGTQPADKTSAALHSGDDDQVEAEYDRLRDLARAEAAKRSSCFDRVRTLPGRGRRTAAHDDD